MKILKGTPVQNGSFVYIQDVIYYDGPLLSLFENEQEEPHLVLWCDCDDTVNRWMRIALTKEDYDSYIDGKVSLLTIIQKQKSVVFYEIFAKCEDNVFEERNFTEVLLEDIDPEYLPTEHFFDKESV